MAKKLTPEQAKALLEKRQAEDPLVHYKMTPTLERVAVAKERNICIMAKNQTGKSAFLCWTSACILRGKHPHLPYFGPTKGLLVVPSRQQASEIYSTRLLKKSELVGEIGKYPFIPKREISRVDWAYSPVGKYPGKITMKNGSTMMVVLSGDPNSWKRLEGMTFDWAIRDEVAGSENMGSELVPRFVASHSRALSGAQPWGALLWWAATETKFNEEWNDFKTRCESHVEDHVSFVLKPEEANAYVSMQAREAMKHSMSATAYAIRGVGDLDAGDLVQIYGKQWDDKRHLLTTDYQVKPSDNLWIGWDPGVEHPTGIVIGALSQDHPRQIKIVKCFLHSRESIDFDVECIHSFMLGRRIAGIVYDYKANERHKHAQSLLHVFQERMEAKGYLPMAGWLKADKRHSVGISQVREYLDPNPFDKTATPLLVLNSSQESGCQMLRSELIGYRGKEASNFTGSGGVVKKNDDTADATRYLVRSTPYWSATYQCGQVTFSVSEPLQMPPEAVPRAEDNSQEAVRRRLAIAAGSRTRQSVTKDFSWYHMAANRGRPLGL
jgi:hypothetical protein